MVLDPTKRFSSRVANYVRYRPGYPTAMFDEIARSCSVGPGAVVADIGSGTGIMTKPILDMGATVFAVEPNAEMRSAAETELESYPNFNSVNARAENTGLPPGSVDLVTAGQAFHWFDPEPAREEIVRILRPPGWVALAWNQRANEREGFSGEYEDLLNEHSPEYKLVTHRQTDDDAIGRFFAPAAMRHEVFENSQTLDYTGLEGRLLSSSYAPEAGQPGHDAMIQALKRLFDRYQAGGTVTFRYDTHLFLGALL